MNIEEFRNYCISKKYVSEDFPFDKQTLVFKVVGKMFALCDVDEFVSINLKCNPELAIELREKYKGVTPGYHMNKKHWNTVSVLGDIPDSLLYNWIDHSYLLVLKSLPLKVQKNL
jgi:predicted DNA-binding protein (MmcQ/YjbR family)